MHILLGCLLACTGETIPTDPSPITGTNPVNNATPELVNTTPKITSSPAVTPQTKKEKTLPDLKQGLSKSGCDNGPGGAGAASYFVGTLNISGESVSGEEDWILYANKKWQAVNGKDCTVHWTLRGTTSQPQACGSCTMGVRLTNSLDIVGSTCPEDMAKGETNKSIQYDLLLHDDGRLIVYFSRSGKKVGEGYHSNGKMTYATDMSCRWF